MEISFKEFKELLPNVVSSDGYEDSPFEVGKAYLIRTVMMIYTGRLVSIHDKEIVIDDAAWIADTGRFHQALKDPSVLKEVEPYPDGDVIIGRGSILDASVWNHPLPRETK